jgi:hypothetical protein
MQIEMNVTYGQGFLPNKSFDLKGKIEVLEDAFLQQPQIDCPVVHRFGPNIYIREVTIPAGSFSIGHYQTTTHLNNMLAGRVTMINDDGTHTELTAPQTFVSKPGRKIGYIHETVIWQNIYATNETNIETLEAMFLNKSETWQEHQKNRQLLLSFDHFEDIADYYVAIAEYGFDQETVQKQVQNLDDQCDFPLGSYKVMVAPSNIDGQGLFATGNIIAGEIIAPARVNGLRTPAGRFTNHAKNPNAIMILLDNGDINLVAATTIDGCQGGNLGKEVTIDYRQALSLAIRRN